MAREKYPTVLNFDLVPPDGGWGYIVALAAAVIFVVTFLPISTFGIVYGSFLAETGDETSATSLVNSIFLTVMHFTGLVANQLLQKISTRKVVLLGTVLYLFGGILNIFVTSTLYLVFSYSIIQGLGNGLLTPALYTILNQYFKKKRSFIVSIINVFVTGSATLNPFLANTLINLFGFRGTLGILTAVCFNCIPAAMCFQPIKWHMKKQCISANYQQYEIKLLQNSNIQVEVLPDKANIKVDPKEIELLNPDLDTQEDVIQSKNKFWQKFVKSLDLALFRDPIYINISIGISLALTADLLFIPMIPLLTDKAGFSQEDQTLIFTVYFLCDLVGRIILSIFVLFIRVPARLLLLIGVLLSAIFRLAFVLSSSFWWVVVTAALLGSFRCLIQTVFPLIFAEVYKERFVTSFSLFMVVSGVIFLICGSLIGLVKKCTDSDTAAVQVLTVAYLCCSIPWIIEIIFLKIKRR